jgi:hypothetical protein
MLVAVATFRATWDDRLSLPPLAVARATFGKVL